MDGIDLHKVTAISETVGIQPFELLFNTADGATKAYDVLTGEGGRQHLADDYGTTIYTDPIDWKYIFKQRLAEAMGGEGVIKLLAAKNSRKMQQRDMAAQQREQAEAVIPVRPGLIDSNGRQVR